MTQRCKGGFAVQGKAGPLVFAAGRLVSDDDPILATHRHLFEPVEAQVARQEATPRSASAVETATAAPGEARQVTTARRRAGQGDGEKK